MLTESWKQCHIDSGYAKFVVRLQKMLRALGIIDSLKSGMTGDQMVLVFTHLKGLQCVGGDSHYATS